MLAQSADDIEDAMSRVPVAALEWKLDGARVQAHKNCDEVRLYSRTGNDVTAAAPEIVAALQGANARSLILDGEAIALKANGAPYAFQETMSSFQSMGAGISGERSTVSSGAAPGDWVKLEKSSRAKKATRRRAAS